MTAFFDNCVCGTNSKNPETLDAPMDFLELRMMSRQQNKLFFYKLLAYCAAQVYNMQVIYKREECVYLRIMSRKGIVRMSGTRIIALGFIAIILFGAILLSLPCASRGEGGVPFIDALFTATTSTCVTGLVVYDTFSAWTLFGQLVILILIQVGGLGFMSLATLFSMVINRRIGFRERMLLSEAISLSSVSGVVRMTRSVIICTICFEGIGAALLATRFIPEFGWCEGIYNAVFHSVSAFCNAGIDLMGKKGAFSSLTSYSGDFIVNATIASLIVIGGLGFMVWEDLYRYRQRRKLRLHTKLVLLISAALIIGGALMIFIFENDNPATLGRMPLWQKCMASLFQSITTRTAGFNTVPLDKMANPSILIMIALMLIGGSPGSTAGGIKTTTVGMLFITAVAVLRGSPQVHVFGRRIDATQIMRALAITTLSICIIALGGAVLLCDSIPFKEAIYEAVSAFGTVGLTLGATDGLGTFSKMSVIIMMYFGRIGVLTALMAITKRQHTYEQQISYPVETIMF